MTACLPFKEVSMTDSITSSKKLRSLPPLLAVFTVFAFFACLNPVDFKPELHVTGDLNLTGEIDVNSVNRDSAVLTVVNRTNSIDVVNTTVRARTEQGALIDPAAIDYGNPAASPPLEGRPLHYRRAEWYLTPSQWDYEITMTYKSIDPAKPVAPNAGIGETRTATIVMSLARPGQPYYVYIVRGKDGVIIVDKENPPSHLVDPEDTVDPKPDPNDPNAGEGSSPAVIPPRNQDKMGVFVVVNKTRTTGIDYVQFTTHHSQPVKSFTMGFSHGADPTLPCANAVAYNELGQRVPYPHNHIVHEPAADDQMSIALRQNAWLATVNYRVAGGYPNPSAMMYKSLSRNVVVSPINDPMALKTNFLYFYRTTTGDYALSPEWPAPDAEDKTSVEVDDGSALFIIRNNAANSYVRALKVVDYHGDKTSKTIDYLNFDPVGYGGYGTSKKVFFTPEGFPFVNGKQYEVQVLIFDERENINKIVVSTRFLNINLGGTYIIDIGRPEVDGAIPLVEDPPQTRFIVHNAGKIAGSTTARITRIEVKTNDDSKTRSFAADQFFGEDWDQSFASTAEFPFVQNQAYKVVLYADIHYHTGANYERGHVCENPPKTLAYDAHNVPFTFTTNDAGNSFVLHNGTGNTTHVITLGEIPKPGFIPVTSVTGMPSVVHADQTLTLAHFATGSYGDTAGTQHAYGPIQVLPVDATALHLPRTDLSLDNSTKITWGFVGSDALTDTVNAQESKASINSATHNWTMKVLEISTASAAKSQKVLLTPPSGPYAGGLVPQTKIFVRVEYGTNNGTQAYIQEFTINAIDVAYPFTAVTSIENFPTQVKAGSTVLLGRGKSNPNAISLLNFGTITVLPANATALNLPQPLLGIPDQTRIEWEFEGHSGKVTLATVGQEVKIESVNKNALSSFANVKYEWTLKLTQDAGSDPLGSQQVTITAPSGPFPLSGQAQINVTAKIHHGAAASGPGHIWSRTFIIYVNDIAPESAPWDVMWGNSSGEQWGNPPTSYYNTNPPTTETGINLLKDVANDVPASFSSIPSTAATQAWNERVYRVYAGTAKIVGPSGEDYGSFYANKFWNHAPDYKLSIMPLGTGPVVLYIGGPVSPGSSDYYYEKAVFPVATNPLDIIWGRATSGVWGYPAIPYESTTPPPDGHMGFEKDAMNYLWFTLVSNDGNALANAVMYHSRVRVLSGNAKVFDKNYADCDTEYNGRTLSAVSKDPVYIKPTGAVGELVEVEIAYPYSASSNEYYTERAKFKINGTVSAAAWSLKVNNYADSTRITGVYVYSWDLTQHTANLITPATASGKTALYGKLSGGGETFTVDNNTINAQGLLGNLSIVLDAKYKVKLVVDKHEHSGSTDSGGYKWNDPHTCNSATLLQDVRNMEIWFENSITPNGTTTGAVGPEIKLNRPSGDNSNEVTLYADKLRGSIWIENDGPPNAFRIALVFRPTTDTVSYQPYSTIDNRGWAPQPLFFKLIDPNKGENAVVNWSDIPELPGDIVIDFKNAIGSTGTSNTAYLPKGKYYVCAVAYSEPNGDSVGGAGQAYRRDKSIMVYGYKKNVWLYVDTEDPIFMGKTPRLFLSSQTGNSNPPPALGTSDLHLRAFINQNTQIGMEHPPSGNLAKVVFRPVADSTTPTTDLGKFLDRHENYGYYDGKLSFIDIYNIAKLGPATVPQGAGAYTPQSGDIVFYPNQNYAAYGHTAVGTFFFYLPPGKYYACVIDGNNVAHGYTKTEWLFVDTADLQAPPAKSNSPSCPFSFHVKFQNTGTRTEPVFVVKKKEFTWQ